MAEVRQKHAGVLCIRGTNLGVARARISQKSILKNKKNGDSNSKTSYVGQLRVAKMGAPVPILGGGCRLAQPKKKRRQLKMGEGVE